MPSDKKRDFDPVYSRRADKKPHYKKKNMRKRRIVGWSIFAVLLLIIGGGLLWGYGAYKSAKKTFKQTYDSTHIQKERNVSSVIKQGKPLSILLLGTDTGALGRHDTGRTDTLIVATVNPKKKTIHLTSIARDTKVVVPGDTQPYEKINAAYTIGGAGTAVKTVQNLLDIPIDFYAIVNMGGLEKMVNAVGGVDVKPPLTFNYGYAHVVKNQKIHLNGRQALDYSRMRDEDPLGDYGRQARQRQIIKHLVMKGLGIASLTRYKAILSSLKGNLKTDMTFDDMIAVRAKYGDATHHIKSQTLQGENAMIDGLSYQVVPNKELLRVSNDIRKSLNLSESTKLKTQQTQTDSNTNYSTGGYSSTTGQTTTGY
ncbi:LCP family protein [Lentilactobacillus farraginis]|uniref:Cell envelope-associated transcriptional attenuator LytR-CpsA-Psr n=2 Tax=Lentilactobacillus farraginis DSM 18382 = JCM 14108 TaxID=1423743 RepID=X0PBI5_9LACO|nr:LCP family protein [Lentilactobacillus farraginis]GAF37258.1 cell envelope-associated transcriptional attenuator LytR-CpsA-Psr [Lentilactobacillus farraginis DSM 18382 = JCM 14108]